MAIRSTGFEGVSFREIHKNSWLTKVSFENTKKKTEKLWTVFCVHDDTDPYLEFYADDKKATTHRPDHHISLRPTNNISTSIGEEPEFVIALHGEVLNLVASTPSRLLDWVTTLRNKLEELRILGPKENPYSIEPVAKATVLSATRDPNSPLPPVPEVQNGRVVRERVPEQSSSEYDLLVAAESRQTLRERQVAELRREMRHPSGVRFRLRQRDVIGSMAFVQVFNAVWISGWKQKEHPLLYNVIHIGDQLFSIENVFINKLSDVNRILKTIPSHSYIDLVVKRTPRAKVFILRREVDGQSLGILREGNSATIQAIEPDSPASRAGLTATTPTRDGSNLTNWVLTEINGRPLNLFFKGNEVRDRLNCVGKDLSVLVQPMELVQQIKRQLKSMNNYKDYVVQ